MLSQGRLTHIEIVGWHTWSVLLVSRNRPSALGNAYLIQASCGRITLTQCLTTEDHEGKLCQRWEKHTWSRLPRYAPFGLG